MKYTSITTCIRKKAAEHSNVSTTTIVNIFADDNVNLLVDEAEEIENEIDVLLK